MLDHGEEKLLKKIHCVYSKEGYREQQDVYDAEENHRYSLYWKYDAHGNVIKEVNALGDTIIKDYDDNDNWIKEEGPRFGDKKEYGYDFSNRLISVTTTEGEKQWAIHYAYDLVGNQTTIIDRYGNETQYKYDDFNRLIKTLYPPVEGVQYETEIGYDDFDRPIQETDARGFVTKKDIIPEDR